MICYSAVYVLPISAAPIRDGAVAVDGGRIVYVGPRTGAPPAEHVDLGQSLLMPGLVNAHCHLELTAMRGFLEDLDFPTWIARLIRGKRGVLSNDQMLDAATFGVHEGIRAGVTTYADTCDSGVAFDALCAQGVRGIMFQEVFGPEPRQCADAMAGLRTKIAAVRPRETPLVRVGISPHSPYSVSDALFVAAGEFARDERLPMAIHIAESELETRLVRDAAGAFADGLRQRGIEVGARAPSPIRLLETLRVLATAPLLIHCVQLDARDIAIVAAARCGVAHCPASNAKLGHGIAPIVELRQAGVAVGLGSDSVASNNRMDILEEARLALLNQRVSAKTPVGLTATDVLAMATLDGARALGLAHRIGSLEVGKAADLAAFSLDGAVPTYDPEVAAVFAVRGADAHFVTVAGEPLLRSGRLLREDPTLPVRVQETADALARWLEGPRAT